MYWWWMPLNHFLKERQKQQKLQASDIQSALWMPSFTAKASIHSLSGGVTNPYAITLRLNTTPLCRFFTASTNWDLHATMLGGIPNSEIAELKNYLRKLFPQLHAALFYANLQRLQWAAITKDGGQRHHYPAPASASSLSDALQSSFAGNQSQQQLLMTTLHNSPYSSWKSVNRPTARAGIKYRAIYPLKRLLP